MPHRFVNFVGALAIGAMASFVAVGCGDNCNCGDDCPPCQQDAGQVDVNQQDVIVTPDDVIQTDLLPQVDAANTSGNVLLVNIGPAKTGDPATDAKFAMMRLARASIGWDPVDPVGDVPVNFIDQRVGPFGCYAKYYKFGQVVDGGAVSAYKPTTANAGTVSVTGYDAGAFITGFSDAGIPSMAPIPGTVTCNRAEGTEDGGAGSGLFEYKCNITPYDSAPTTAFMKPMVDKLTFSATGSGIEIGPFEIPDVDVMPNIQVSVPGAMWMVPALVQDAGVTFPYTCGPYPVPVTDAGPQPTACPGAMALRITWTDVDSPGEFAPRAAVNEMGIIQCAKVGAGTSYTIPLEIWQAAFPTGNNWRSIQAYITHVSVKTAHGMSTVMGAGGGEVGMTYHP